MAQPNSVFAALADPRRRRILESLSTGGVTAGEIAKWFDVSWPAISRHLRILKAAGLLWETRDGRTRYYEVNQQAMAPVMNWLMQFRAAPGPAPIRPTPGPNLIGREYTS